MLKDVKNSNSLYFQARNMKDATGLQMEELSEKFSNIQIESDQNVRNVVDLLNNLLQAEQEPYNDVKKNLKVRKLPKMYLTSILKSVA